MSTGVQTYLATFARSFKEAQSYMGFLIMVPMLPGMLSAMYPICEPAVDVSDSASRPAHARRGRRSAASPRRCGRSSSPESPRSCVALLTMQMTTRMLQRERIIFSRYKKGKKTLSR